MPANIINIAKVVEDKENKSNELQIVDIDISEKKDQHKQKLDHYQKIIQFLDNFDIDELETKKELINSRKSIRNG